MFTLIEDIIASNDFFETTSCFSEINHALMKEVILIEGTMVSNSMFVTISFLSVLQCFSHESKQ